MSRAVIVPDLLLEAISKKSFRPDLCRPAERFFQLDGLEETSTGGRGSSGVGISLSQTKILILR
jgi:hypothetical protein